MSKIDSLEKYDEETVCQLVDIWESAVRNTHTFLSEQDIDEIKLEVYQGLKEIELLYGYWDDEGTLKGFIGVVDQKIEMLFIDNSARGEGIGKQLLSYGIDKLNANSVDVNEQNEQGVGFYRHMGFYVIGRSEFDDQGRSFPLLHLEIRK